MAFLYVLYDYLARVIDEGKGRFNEEQGTTMLCFLLVLLRILEDVDDSRVLLNFFFALLKGLFNFKNTTWWL